MNTKNPILLLIFTISALFASTAQADGVDRLFKTQISELTNVCLQAWDDDEELLCLVGGLRSLIVAESRVVSALNGRRDICSSASVDTDGDGWGWEHNKSCIVLGSKVDKSKSSRRRKAGLEQAEACVNINKRQRKRTSRKQLRCIKSTLNRIH